MDESTLHLMDTQLKNHHGIKKLVFGGAIRLMATPPKLMAVFSNLTLTRVHASGYFVWVDGGVIYAVGAHTMEINDCVFEDNEALEDGGALELQDGARAVITNSTFRRNSAKSSLGGALNALLQVQLKISDIPACPLVQMCDMWKNAPYQRKMCHNRRRP